jgi:hypothetical protein
MLFSLEVLQAKHGDCLLLHYGEAGNPKVIVIDGGPSGIYRKFLKPRLLELKESRSPEEPLPLAMVMVSHADDDHINGIVMLTKELVGNVNDNEPSLFAIDNFWFNSFDDIIGNIEIPVVSAMGASTEAASISSLGIPQLLMPQKEHIAAVIASTGQGRQIRKNAEALGLAVNVPFPEMEDGKPNLVRGDIDESAFELDGLNITVIHPNEQRIQELQKQWDKDLKKAAADGDPNIIFASIASLDKSPFNLSSIVCLVEAGGKTMLLTGDGRSDDILEGLERAGLLDAEGKIHVNILKMPHHGSDANMTPEFLQRVTADHYVTSADGAHHNPDQGTLDMFVGNVKKGTLHFTNHDGDFELAEKMDAFRATLDGQNSRVKVAFRKEEDASFVINLLDEIDF